MRLFYLLLFLFVGWTSTEWNSGVNVRNVGNGFVLDFPRNGHVNLIKDGSKKFSFQSVIAITYKITGQGKFHSLDTSQGLKPNFRVMLFNGNWYDQNGRWWPTGANCAFLVADGQQHIYSVKVKPWLWSNVYGKQNKQAFQSFLGGQRDIYLAFGGGNSFSHGISGSGRLQVLSVQYR